jgi:hypothetical protein
MTTPNRWKMVGDFKVIAKGKVLDVNKNEEFDGELRFTSNNLGIETTTIDGINHAKVNGDLIKDDECLWELVVRDEMKEHEEEESDLTKKLRDLVYTVKKLNIDYNERKINWESVVHEQPTDNTYDNDTLTTLGLTNDKLVKYVAKLQQTTKHSSEQVHNFIKVLVNRFKEIGITSLQELFIRYESTRGINASEVLKEVGGVYHLNNLQALINIMLSEKKSKEYIEHYNKLIEKEQEKQIALDKSSEEYIQSVEQELRWLNNKKQIIEKLK